MIAMPRIWNESRVENIMRAHISAREVIAHPHLVVRATNEQLVPTLVATNGSQ